MTYDIPAIRLVYSGLKPVRIVKEYDIKSMARAANEVLKMGDEEYEMEHNDEEVRKFLDDHSSWEKVAKETYDFLSEFI